jgi:hypothetical protein
MCNVIEFVPKGWMAAPQLTWMNANCTFCQQHSVQCCYNASTLQLAGAGQVCSQHVTAKDLPVSHDEPP